MIRKDGLVMKGQRLPAEHNVVRYVPFSKLRKDENDNVIGVLGVAFKLRDSESYLSTTWLEYFAGNREEKIVSAVKAIRASSISPGGKSGFAVGNVGSIIAACAARNHSIRVVHEPEDDNKAHASVRRMPRDDGELLEILAAEDWAELVLNSEIEDGAEAAPDTEAGGGVQDQ